MLVIMDCDGVLVDSEPLSNQALSETLVAHGMPMSPQECVQAFMGRTWASCAKIIEERFGRVPEGFHAAYTARMRAAFSESLQPVPGVLDAVGRIPSPMCVASSGSREKMRFTLGLVGLWDRFEGRIFSAWDPEVVHGKPAPDLFLWAASSSGVAPGECVVVEDSPVGVAAARAAGMRVLGFAGRTPAGWLRDADTVFSRMSELPGLLRSLQ